MTLPTDFDIFSPRLNKNPCTTTDVRQGEPADIRKAGQIHGVEACDVLADDVQASAGQYFGHASASASG